jgi:hypothetical protein
VPGGAQLQCALLVTVLLLLLTVGAVQLTAPALALTLLLRSAAHRTALELVLQQPGAHALNEQTATAVISSVSTLVASSRLLVLQGHW